jgi:hypothetical protein
MPETTTERLGLIKPARDTNTPLDIERLNLNMDTLDRAVGAAIITKDTTPPSTELYDGKIVREKETGRVWMAEKQSNGSFAKKWITWPYLFTAYTSNYPFIPNKESIFTWLTYDNASVHSLNAQPTDMFDSFWVCPMKGVWHLDARFIYLAGSPNHLFWTISKLAINASRADANAGHGEDLNTQDVSYPPPLANNSTSHSVLQTVLNAGDTVCGRLTVATDQAFTTTTGIFKATMIHPIS